MFDTVAMSTFFPESKAQVFNAGAPVWGLDWCPIHPSERKAWNHKRYLAVGVYPSKNHSPDVGVKAKRPSKACIQLWSYGPAIPPTGLGTERGQSIPESHDVDMTDDDEVEEDELAEDTEARGHDAGVMKFEMVICIDSGPAYELKWCPLPSHDLETDSRRPRKLGILAGTFEDGSLSIYAIPDYRNLSSTSSTTQQENAPIFVKLPEPLIRIELEETCCWALDWANSEILAVGTTHDTIAVFNVSPHLNAFTSPGPLFLSLQLTYIALSYLITKHSNKNHPYHPSYTLHNRASISHLSSLVDQSPTQLAIGTSEDR
ncbi:hypothetical protein AX16_005134 [Volvariella volvacea WC 439]|nr:hypothetical protein AX16_005134 [Volvariella volvacea WC 439]